MPEQRTFKVGQIVTLVKSKGRDRRRKVRISAVLPNDRYRYRVAGSMVEHEEGRDPGVLQA